MQKMHNLMTSYQLHSTSWSKPLSSLVWLITVTASRFLLPHLPTTQRPVKTKSDYAATLLKTLQFFPPKLELKPKLYRIWLLLSPCPDLPLSSLPTTYDPHWPPYYSFQWPSYSWFRAFVLSIPLSGNISQTFAWLVPALPSGLCSKAILSIWLSLTILYKQHPLPTNHIPCTP